MKKFIALMLVIVCVLCLAIGVSGCSTTQPADETIPTVVDDVTVPVDNTTPAVEDPTIPVTQETTPVTQDITPVTQDTVPTKQDTTSTKQETETNKNTVAIQNNNVLTAAKAAAKNALESYVKAENYRQAQKAQLATAIANGKTAIDAAADQAGIDAALAAAKAAIQNIATDAELTAQENAAAAEALQTAKTTAKTALENYAKAEDYRQAQKAQLATAIANGKTAIDAAADQAGVDAALAAAKAVIDSVETDAQITAKSPTITTAITDGMVFTNTRATLDVWAKDSNGNKLSCSKVTVTVNGVAAAINWDDTIKTSYNFVLVPGDNTIVITACDGDYSTSVTYQVVCDMEAAATITVSVEAFTVGLGYLVEPYNLVLDEATLTDMAQLYGYDDAEEMKQYLSAAHALDYTLYINGLTMSYQGSLHSTYNGFYMSSVSGVDTSYLEVPEVLAEALDAYGFYADPYVMEDGTLCEFDVTWGSGWMYFINNEFPNVPFCDYVPQDGDVMRVQFTLAYGSDLGDWGMMGEPFFEVVDRDELTACIAEAVEAGVDYTEAFQVVSTFGVTQDELDAACEELKQRINS